MRITILVLLLKSIVMLLNHQALVVRSCSGTLPSLMGVEDELDVEGDL
jgi:hypothetical protein